MKLNLVKSLLVFGVSALLGLLCYVIAKDVDYRNWISFASATLSIYVCLESAIACEYNCGNRNVNIKVCAWVFSIMVVIANFVFSCFMYNVLVYIAVVSILALMDVASVYALCKPQEK